MKPVKIIDFSPMLVALAFLRLNAILNINNKADTDYPLSNQTLKGKIKIPSMRINRQAGGRNAFRFREPVRVWFHPAKMPV